jgi:hypothetical protein
VYLRSTVAWLACSVALTGCRMTTDKPDAPGETAGADSAGGDSASADSGRDSGTDSGADSGSGDTGWDPAGDSDGDGLTDAEEGRGDDTSRDSDTDGTPDYLDGDSDDDGLRDVTEAAPFDGEPPDTDADGTADYLDNDSDADGLADAVEGDDDWDGDGTPNWRDPRNDGSLAPVRFVAISTDFTQPIGIDFHESAFDVVMSVNYSSGTPHALETVAADGSHARFSSLSGVTDEVKIATARSGGSGGFEVGELFVGNGVDGQIVRISADGSTVTNPWVDLPGASNGLMRGSLYVDRTDVFGGDLIVATTNGEVWRVDSAGSATRVAAIGVHLEGLVTVPDAPARYGPLAGTILAGAENEGLLWAIAPDGSVRSYDVDVQIEDIDIVTPYENFFGINFGTSSLIGASGDQFLPIAGDILLTQESVTSVGLYRLYFDGASIRAEELRATSDSARIAQWEHVTFAGAGIQEVP